MSDFVPRYIHRLWLGPRPMPGRFHAYGERWERLNPGWVVRDWSWHNLPGDLANEGIMDDLRSRCSRGGSVELATQLADIIDYDLVFRYGGIYVNADIEPVRPLLPEMFDGRPWATYEEPWAENIVNCAFGGPAGHPFWGAVLQRLPERYWHCRRSGVEEMNQMTGPRLLTEVALQQRGQLYVFSSEVVNPVYWAQIPLGETADGRWSMDSLPAVTVAVHHWDHRRVRRSNIVR